MNPNCAAWRIDGALDVLGNTSTSRSGRGGATGFVRDGKAWRAAYFPGGSAAVAAWVDGSTLRAEAWGDGAVDALAAVPAWVGLRDDAAGFDPSGHRLLRDAAAQHPGTRLGRTDDVFDALVPVIIRQKVTSVQAIRSYQTLVRRVGRRAPLPHVSRRPLFLPPTPEEVLTALSGHGAATLALDVKRTAALREVALLGCRLNRLATLPAPEARAALAAIPGLGIWTANEATLVALGDPDAVSVGDYHLKNIVGFALTGAPRSTDEQMVALLEPYRPHRARAVRLIALSGVRAPKYGPRTTVPDHLPLMTDHRPSRDAASRSRVSRTRRRPR